MSKEYIDKDEFYDVIDGGFDLNFDELPETKAALLDMIRNFDPADVKPVVLCKDCKHSYEDLGGLTCSHGVCVDSIVAPSFYCANGERREE